MKKKPGIRLRTVCGNHLLVAEGLENIDFSQLVTLSETGAYLWENICEEEEITVGRLAELLTREYDVSADVARRDAEKFIKELLSAEVLSQADA